MCAVVVVEILTIGKRTVSITEATYRVSWDRHGTAHWTDEGITDERDPRRHRDPRR